MTKEYKVVGARFVEYQHKEKRTDLQFVAEIIGILSDRELNWGWRLKEREVAVELGTEWKDSRIDMIVRKRKLGLYGYYSVVMAVVDGVVYPKWDDAEKVVVEAFGGDYEAAREYLHSLPVYGHNQGQPMA